MPHIQSATCSSCRYTAELQPADISIQQPLKHSIKQQAMQLFAESVCRDEAVLDLRVGTMKRLMAHWAWRHLSWTFEEAPRLAARATRVLLKGTLFEGEPTFHETEMKKAEPPEETELILQDDDDDAEDPESTGTAVAEAVVPFPSNAKNASCICAARTASIH